MDKSNLNNIPFTVYEPVETFKEPLYTMDLLNDIKFKDFEGFTPDGIPSATNTFSKEQKQEIPQESRFEFNEPEDHQNYYNNLEEEIQNTKSNSSLTGDKKQALNFFYTKLLDKNKGKKNAESLSYIQASGIVGNLIYESGLRTGIKGDGGRAFGIAQWHPDRQKGLVELAKSRGTDIFDFNTQLEYVWKELNSTEKKALDSLLSSTNVEQSTEAFMNHYERPGIKSLKKRINNAKSLLSS